MRALLAGGLMAAILAPAVAQTPPPAALRDPTKPPAGYGAVLSLAASAPATSFQPRQVVFIDGEHYLVWNGRRYRVGDTIEGARIERVGESEVWLRGAEGLRKLLLFAGVEKRPPRTATPTVTLGEEAATSKKGQKK